MSPMEFQPVTLKPTVSEVQELYSIQGWLSMIVEPYKQLVVKHPLSHKCSNLNKTKSLHTKKLEQKQNHAEIFIQVST